MRRTDGVRVWMGVLGLLSGMSFSMAPAQAETDFQAQILQAVQASKAKLGNLKPWQIRVFDQEVMGAYSRFVRDYRVGDKATQTLVVDVDLKAIEEFLEPGVSSVQGTKSRTVWILAEIDQECGRCKSSLSDIQNYLTTRIQSRGFEPHWVDWQSWRAERYKGDNYTQSFEDAAKGKGAAGAVVLSFERITREEREDLKDFRYRMKIQSALFNKDRIYTQDSVLGLNDSDATDTVMKRIWVQAMTDLGSQIKGRGLASMDGSNEYWVEVRGIADHEQYRRVKSYLQTKFESLGKVEDRKMTRGSVTFALDEKANAKTVRKLLNSRSVAQTSSSVNLIWVEEGERSAVLEVQP